MLLSTARVVRLLCVLALMTAGLPVCAEIDIPSDGSDGSLSPPSSPSSYEVDLSLAATGRWDQPSPVPGRGVYDPDKWAVVFKYQSVNIPSGVTVSFKPHPSGAPVVWLVKGNVTINGNINLKGRDNSSIADPPGVGGFRGGPYYNNYSLSGLGWGGGTRSYGHGRYAGVYGNPQIVPLIGGSGAREGGAGGNAILIACRNTVLLSGSIDARGGSSYPNASGGAIRILADSLTGAGKLYVGSGDQAGRIRLEARYRPMTWQWDTTPSFGEPDTPPLLWPPDTAPRVAVLSVDSVAVPQDPRARFSYPWQDVSISNTGQSVIRVQAWNVPLLDWAVTVRVCPRTSGDAFFVAAEFVSGDDQSSIWEARCTLPGGFCGIQARAHKL